jgi:hypothetical protein
MGHVVAPKLSYARTRELAPRDVWQHPNSLSGDSGAGATRHMVAPLAALSQEAGADATGGVAAPELPVPGGII